MTPPRPLVLPDGFTPAHRNECSNGYPVAEHTEYSRPYHHVVVAACPGDCGGWCFFTRSGEYGNDVMAPEDAVLVRDLDWAVANLEEAENLKIENAALKVRIQELEAVAENLENQIKGAIP